MQKYMKFSLLTVVLLLSAVMLTTIDGSQNSVQAQNITSTLLPSTLPPQDGTSVPTTPAQASFDGEDASSSSSDSVSDDASESGDVSDLQEDASSGVGSNSVPITPSKSSDNNDESSSNSGNDESSGSSEIGEGEDNNDNDNDDNNNISSQDTLSNEDNDSDTEGDVSSSDKEADETDDVFTDGKKKYGKSQVVTQVNACGNLDMPINIGCQNTASQIQGDDNRIATAAAQSFDD